MQYSLLFHCNNGLRTNVPQVLRSTYHAHLVMCQRRPSAVFHRSYSCSAEKVKQSHYRPGQALRFPEVCVSRLQDNWHMNVVRLLALRTGRLYPQEILLALISIRGRVNPRAIVRQEEYVNEKFQ